MAYNEDEYLQLSGIQHFRFCRRQWALIHIENLWAENVRTVDGELMHERAHDSGLREKRAGVIVTRDLAISSPTLGRFRPYPVEYKHGSPREDLANELQLCGQAMCLEEMLCCDIQKGALYFGEMRHRIEVEFTPELRREVVDTMKEMHSLYRRGHTPKVKPTKSCNACSLKDLCLPRMSRCGSVKSYLQRHMEEIP